LKIRLPYFLSRRGKIKNLSNFNFVKKKKHEKEPLIMIVVASYPAHPFLLLSAMLATKRRHEPATTATTSLG
jgi:hypothetical protein